MQKRSAVNKIEDAMGRNLGLRNFLEIMNDCFRDDPNALEEINKLMRGLIIDQRNLINMRDSADSYVVQQVVAKIWEE